MSVAPPTYLRKWREFAGLTQEALGKLLGISGAQISRLERGGRDPDLRFLVRFMGAINGHLGPKAPIRIEYYADPLWLDPGVLKRLILRSPKTMY